MLGFKLVKDGKNIVPTPSQFLLPVVILLAWNTHKEEDRLEDATDQVQRLRIVRALSGHVHQQLTNN